MDASAATLHTLSSQSQSSMMDASSSSSESASPIRKACAKIEGSSSIGTANSTDVTTRLSLELTGSNSSVKTPDNGISSTSPASISIRKVSTHEPGRQWWVVVLPATPKGVDAVVAATKAAELVREHIELLSQQQERQTIVVDRIKISNLSQWTWQGISALQQRLLAIHKATVKHLALQDVVPSRASTEGAASSSTGHSDTILSQILSCFMSSQLDILDLSRNRLDAFLWQSLAKSSNVMNRLQQLILDQVTISDDSMHALANLYAGTDENKSDNTLEDLHLVLSQPLNSSGIAAANRLLQSCQKLTSLRWVHKYATPDTRLPVQGMRLMAQAKYGTQNAASASLQHLVLEGGNMSDCGDLQELCVALSDFATLKTLKLRRLQLDDAGLQQVIVTGIRKSRPPLECLDLSGNMISDDGVAQSVVQLAEVPKIMKTLRLLALSGNQIGDAGAVQLFRVYSGAAAEAKSPQLQSSLPPATPAMMDLRLDGNAFDFGKVCYELAVAQHQAQVACDVLRRERDRLQIEASDAQKNFRNIMAGQTGVFAELHMLQMETKKLREDKDALVKAFSVLGMGKQMEERKRISDRLAKLEDAILVKPVMRRKVQRRASLNDTYSQSDSNQSQVQPSSILRTPSFRSTNGNNNFHTNPYGESMHSKRSYTSETDSVSSLSHQTPLRTIQRSNSFDDACVSPLSTKGPSNPNSPAAPSTSSDHKLSPDSFAASSIKGATVTFPTATSLDSNSNADVSDDVSAAKQQPRQQNTPVRSTSERWGCMLNKSKLQNANIGAASQVPTVALSAPRSNNAGAHQYFQPHRSKSKHSLQALDDVVESEIEDNSNSSSDKDQSSSSQMIFGQRRNVI